MARSLLSQAEAQAFGAHLRDAREQARLSISAVGGENRTQWRRYESGEVVPSPTVLRRFAQACAISEFVLLERAGHFEQLLRPIVSLLALGHAEYERWRTTKRRRKSAWENVGNLYVPFESYVAVLLVIRGFPRRNEGLALAIARGYNPELDEAAEAALAVTFVPGHLPQVISRARSALQDNDLPTDVRRNVAAEYVHAYVCDLEPDLYQIVYSRIYQENPK